MHLLIYLLTIITSCLFWGQGSGAEWCCG